jgi:hypothetical protein
MLTGALAGAALPLEGEGAAEPAAAALRACSALLALEEEKEYLQKSKEERLADRQTANGYLGNRGIRGPGRLAALGSTRSFSSQRVAMTPSR